jgi:small-conductance mechanosensitive channel
MATVSGNSTIVNSTFLQKIIHYFQDEKILMNIGYIALKIIIIFIVARLIVKIADKTTSHMMAMRERSPLKIDLRRSNTIGKLVHNLISYTVNFIAIMLILDQIGLNLGPLLAGAGVVGLAVGFGAQNLVRDVITGFFIIFEDQFAVGDVIQIDNFKGTVEQIGIRITRLKSWTGEVHIIPNGNIKQVTNFSVNNSLAVIDIPVAYETDIDRVLEVLKEITLHEYENNDKIVAEPQVLGVQTLSNSELLFRIIAECKPNMQGDVMRSLHAEIKKRLDAEGVEIPYPKSVTFVKSLEGGGR